MRASLLAMVALLGSAGLAAADTVEATVDEEVRVSRELPPGSPTVELELRPDFSSLEAPNPLYDAAQSALGDVPGVRSDRERSVLLLEAEEAGVAVLLPWRSEYALHRQRVVLDPDHPVAALLDGEAGVELAPRESSPVVLRAERDGLSLIGPDGRAVVVGWPREVFRLERLEADPALVAPFLLAAESAGRKAFDAGEQGLDAAREAYCTVRDSRGFGACGGPFVVEADGLAAADVRGGGSSVHLFHSRNRFLVAMASAFSAEPMVTDVSTPGVAVPLLAILVDGRPPSLDDSPTWDLLDATWSAASAAWDSAAFGERLSERREIPLAVSVANPVPAVDATPEAPADPGLAPVVLPAWSVSVHVKRLEGEVWAGPPTAPGTATVRTESHAPTVAGAAAPFLREEAPAKVAEAPPSAEEPVALRVSAAGEDPAPPARDRASELHAAGTFVGETLSWSARQLFLGAALGAGLLLPVWVLYRRIQQAKALESPQRRAIYERIVAHPGATPGDLRAETGLHYTTCVHHVRVLHELGYIEVRKLGGTFHCFENHGRYGATETRLVAAAQSENARGLLRLVLRKPDLTPADAAHALGIARSSAKHHVDRLVGWGLLVATRDGPNVRLRVAPDAVDALVGLLSSDHKTAHSRTSSR